MTNQIKTAKLSELKEFAAQNNFTPAQVKAAAKRRYPQVTPNLSSKATWVAGILELQLDAEIKAMAEAEKAEREAREAEELSQELGDVIPELDVTLEEIESQEAEYTQILAPQPQATQQVEPQPTTPAPSSQSRVVTSQKAPHQPTLLPLVLGTALSTLPHSLEAVAIVGSTGLIACFWDLICR